MNFVTSVFKKYINKNESDSTDSGQRKQAPGELPAATTASQQPENLNKSDEEEFQDAETNAPTSTSPGDTQQTISISSNNTVTNQDIQSPEISQQQMRFSSTSAITEPDSLDTSIIDSLDVLQQTDASNLIDSIEIPHLIDTINEYEQGLQSHQKHSKEFIAAECSDSSKQQEKPLTERNEMQVESNLEEASFEGALEQLIRSVNETLVLNDSSLNNVLIKDLQPDLQSNKELNHNSDTTAIVSETQTDTTPKNPAFHQSSSDSINKSNETHDTSHNPTKSMPQELSDGILAESQTTQQNLDQFSEKNTGIDDQSCASPNQYEQPQPTTSQEKQFTAANNLTETNTDETPLDNNESPVNKNVDDETDTTDIAYERQETKEFEKLEELAANTEDTSSSKFEINDILDYLVAKSTSPTHETEQELQVEPEQKLNKQPPIEAVPLGLLQEIATLPLPDDDDSPLETNKTFFRQDTGEFEAIEKQCLLDVQNEKKLSEVPEENSSKAMEGEAVKQTNELESKLVAKNCEETAVESPTRDVLEETKTNGEKNVSENIKNDVVKSAQSEIDQSEAILLDLMAEKFIVLPAQHFEGKTPVQEVSKTLCRQDTHEFEIMEKQCMLEAQKEQNSDKLDKVSEILEDVNKIKDGVNDSSSSSADTVIAVNESNKTGVTEEVIIQHNNEHLDKNYLNNKTLTEEVVKESSVKTSAGNNSQIEGFTKLLVANEREISQEGKPCENKNCVLDTSFHSSAAINAQNTSQDYDQEKKVSENPQVTSYNDTQIAQIAKDCKSQDEVILKQSHKCLSKGEPSGFSNATNDAQPTITDKEISSDNVLNDKVESNDVVTLENDANQVDSRKSPSVKPQFNKQNRKSETRNKAEVRPTVRANKPIPTQKIASQNDNLCKDHPVTDHEDSAAKVTNSLQCDETNIVSKMKQMVAEYEMQISMQAAELERLQNEAEMNVRHFTNTEMAFSDLFEKYEKSKAVIAVYRRNEDILLENIERAEEQLVQLESKCQAMKQQSMTEIRRAEYQVNQEKEKYKRDISKMQGQIKRLEIKASSLELALKQKNDECQALAALCDDITGRTTNN